MKKFIKINEKDNVVVALSDLYKNEVISIGDREILLKQYIKAGHKLAVTEINEESNIIKYGFPIGKAVVPIKSGELVHLHNTKTNLTSVKEYSYNRTAYERVYKKESLTFKGYLREDGNVGVRNELWIVPTVGCVNGLADKIIEKFNEKVRPQGIDYVGVFKHSFGCSQLGQDEEATRKFLCNMVKHPNAGGILVFSLGCENNNLKVFKEMLGEHNENRVRFLVAQQIEDEIGEGVKLLEELYQNMKDDKRKDIPLSELKVGLKCGASDGFSGITANPLVGEFSDFLIDQGGTTVLTEVPEIFGAETILMERGENKEVFDKLVNLINDYKGYFKMYNEPVYENASPGNKDGGLTTVEDKSLGCTQKAGTAVVKDVLKYGELISKRGLNILSAPGNDLVASSALAASGCQIVLFTTGRGTPFGTFVPTVKISINSDIFRLKQNWIDINSGVILEEKDKVELLKEFIKYVLDVASGELVNNEKNAFREIAIFKNGVTL
jgi:altronate hydrolase